MKTLMFLLAGVLMLPAAVQAAELSYEEIREVGLQPIKAGTESIDFELETLAGGTRSLNSFKGKVVFLNFWASWCGPCRQEMPSMQRLYERLKGEGLEIVAVNLHEDKATVQKFIDEHELTFPVLLDKNGRVGATYGTRSIPTTYVIDREGFVVAGTVGTREWDSDEYIRFFQRLLQ